jgi:hypothetical protein
MYISMDILKLVCRHIVNRLNYVVILIIQLNPIGISVVKEYSFVSFMYDITHRL